MYFLLAKHLRDNEWHVAIAEIPDYVSANNYRVYEEEEDKPNSNWEYKIVRSAEMEDM